MTALKSFLLAIFACSTLVEVVDLDYRRNIAAKFHENTREELDNHFKDHMMTQGILTAHIQQKLQEALLETSIAPIKYLNRESEPVPSSFLLNFDDLTQVTKAAQAACAKEGLGKIQDINDALEADLSEVRQEVADLCEELVNCEFMDCLLSHKQKVNHKVEKFEVLLSESFKVVLVIPGDVKNCFAENSNIYQEMMKHEEENFHTYSALAEAVSPDSTNAERITEGYQNQVTEYHNTIRAIMETFFTSYKRVKELLTESIQHKLDKVLLQTSNYTINLPEEEGEQVRSCAMDVVSRIEDLTDATESAQLACANGARDKIEATTDALEADFLEIRAKVADAFAKLFNCKDQNCLRAHVPKVDHQVSNINEMVLQAQDDVIAVDDESCFDEYSSVFQEEIKQYEADMSDCVTDN